MVLRTSVILCFAGALVVGGMWLVGCEKKPEGGGVTPAVAPAPGAAVPPAPAAAAAASLMGTASITGSIKVSGTVPPPVSVNMASKPECEKAHGGQIVPSDQLLAGTVGELKDVFVYVKKGIAGKYPPPATPATIDQKGCMYSPHVFGVQVEQDIQVLNSDPFLHNINVGENHSFNLAMTGGQAPEIKKAWFKKEGVPTKFKCEVHAWMGAYACVVPHPFWGITGADGKFSIGKLPAGKYTLAIWHEAYPGLTAPAQKEIEIEVKEGEAKIADFTYTFSK